MKLLEGKRTYLSAIVMIVLAGCKALGYIDENTYQIAIGIAGAAGLAALRGAVGKE